jgi:hypothetical protein
MSKREPKCGFCGRKASRVRLLLKGEKGALICDVCILKAMHGLIKKLGGEV